MRKYIFKSKISFDKKILIVEEFHICVYRSYSTNQDDTEYQFFQ